MTLLDASGARLSAQAVPIPPQGASMARVEFPAEGALGGLRVQYSGGMDDVLVGAGIEDGIAGYSANLPMAMTGMPDADGPRQFQFASPGIMNGPADPMMGFPKGLAFRPYIYLRNVASSPRAVQASVNWMNGSSPQTASLPAIVLQPGESRQLSPPPFPGGEPEAFNFVFSFEGSVQDVLAATGGVDATGNYVFPVEPHGVGRHGGMTSVYWSYGGGFDTMYSVWNPLSIAQQAQLLLVGPDGRLIYAAPIRLAAQASAMIDLYELFASGKPDAAGRALPPGPMHGTAVLTGPKNDTTERMTIVLAGATYNARTATCGSNCETCNGFTSVSATPSPESVAVSGSSQMQDEYTWYTGYQYNYTTSSTWSTNYPSIASIQVHSALLTGVSGGSFEVSADFGDLPTNAGQICTEGSLPSCPIGTPVAQATGTAYQLTCSPQPVTRGSTMTCSVAGVQAGEVSSWQFSGGQANVTAPGGVTSWTGLMVQGGTVSANLNIAGNLAAPFVSVTVNPRTNFTVSMPTPGLKPNGTPPLPVLTSPPDTSEGAFGQSRYQYYFNPMTAQVPSGPNEGFTYVTALDTSLSYFIYELNPGLVTPSDPFYQHQYGNCGIPSVQQIVTAVTNHEAGASSSHWSEMAAQMAASNPGPVAEKEVGLPGTTPQALNGQASKDLTPYFAAVANAGIPEPPTNLPPNINFPPYRTCP